MTIQEFHQEIRKYAAEINGRYFSPEEIDQSIYRSTMDLFMEELRNFESLRRISDSLGHFKSAVVLTKTQNVNTVTLPPDYVTMTDDPQGQVPGYDFRQVRMLTDHTWISQIQSENFGATEQYPYGRLAGQNLLQIEPMTIVNIAVYYLRKPKKNKFAYTVASDGMSFIFAPAGSTDVEWPEIGHSRILVKALGYLGIATRDQLQVQAQTVLENTTQPKDR
jgi:hypothetical protein